MRWIVWSKVARRSCTFVLGQCMSKLFVRDADYSCSLFREVAGPQELASSADWGQQIWEQGVIMSVGQQLALADLLT